jgi:hypothetical protein
MQKQVWIARLLLIFGGLLGLHLFYLRRDKQAFLSIVSFGGFGFGLLRDFFMIPTYVQEVNFEPNYVEMVKAQQKYSNAKASWTINFAQLFFANYLCWSPSRILDVLMPIENQPPTTIMFAMLARALVETIAFSGGIYLVGTSNPSLNINFRKLFEYILGARLFFYALQNQGFFWPVFCGIIAFNRNVKWNPPQSLPASTPVIKRGGRLFLSVVVLRLTVTDKISDHKFRASLGVIFRLFPTYAGIERKREIFIRKFS